MPLSLTATTCPTGSPGGKAPAWPEVTTRSPTATTPPGGK